MAKTPELQSNRLDDAARAGWLYYIAHCLQLSQRLTDKYGLELCEVVPADPASQSVVLGVAEATAAELERRLESQHPIVIALGSGRTLRAAADQLPPMDCPQHKIVSLVGNIAPDGSASFYDVITRQFNGELDSAAATKELVAAVAAAK